MLSLRILFSAFLGNMASGILPLMLYGFAWMGGVVESLGRVLDIQALVNTGIVTSLLIPTDILWRGASYYLTPVAAAMAGALGQGNPFISVPIATPMVMWALLYVVAAFLVAAVIFSRRDI